MGTTVSALAREREMFDLKSSDILRSRDRDEEKKKKKEEQKFWRGGPFIYYFPANPALRIWLFEKRKSHQYRNRGMKHWVAEESLRKASKF